MALRLPSRSGIQVAVAAAAGRALFCFGSVLEGRHEDEDEGLAAGCCCCCCCALRPGACDSVSSCLSGRRISTTSPVACDSVHDTTLTWAITNHTRLA